MPESGRSCSRWTSPTTRTGSSRGRSRHRPSSRGDVYTRAVAHEHDHELTDAEASEEAERLVRRDVALAQIRQYGDPALRMRAAEVETFDDELRRVSERMTSLMHDAEGVGLAATQVGILRRFFVCTLDGVDRVLVNPVVTPVSDDAEIDQEGCLSLGPIRLPIERALRVKVE